MLANLVFTQVMECAPWPAFLCPIAKNRGDFNARTFTSRATGASTKGVSLMDLTRLITFTTTVCVVLSGCAANTPFPPNVMERVSPIFQFEAWRDASPSNEAGKTDSGHRVELGGRIVQASRKGQGIVIVAEQLPIVKHHVYGPTDDVKRTGDYEFAFFYPGELEPQDLKNGNRFVMVGTTTSRRPVVVNGVPKTAPFLVASCVHVWQTGRTENSVAKVRGQGSPSPLQEKTYCVAKQ